MNRPAGLDAVAIGENIILPLTFRKGGNKVFLQQAMSYENS